MLNKIKKSVMTVVGPNIPGLQDVPTNGHIQGSGSSSRSSKPDKFTYSRPAFLQLMTYDELKASADHNVRPIIVPRDVSVMPWFTGYAECVNSGKSEWNEDQAAFHSQLLSHPNHPDVPYTYFGMFDGHAGYGAALAAANQFHYILHEKLVDVIEMLMPQKDNNSLDFSHSLDRIPSASLFQRKVTQDEVIIGALESAFVEMDAVIAEDRPKYKNAGGCTAIVSLFILGKMFVANAGDSRAVLCQRVSKERLTQFPNRSILSQSNSETHGTEDKEAHVFPVPYSHDHTPDTERPRLMTAAKLNPSFLGNDYIAMEYVKRPMVKDLGSRTLYRQGNMRGWAYKTLTREDLKMPIVTGEGKRSRLLGTIGVTRGFGDHDLRALGSGIFIKPFLSCHPDVTVRDLSKVITDEGNEDGDFGLLVMATDGLWDVADIDSVSQTVFNTLNKNRTEKHRYTMVAQELVAKSRGKINESGHWRLADSKAAATVDDISVLVIPVYQYYKEYVEWSRKTAEEADKVNQQQIVQPAEIKPEEQNGDQTSPMETTNGVEAMEADE